MGFRLVVLGLVLESQLAEVVAAGHGRLEYRCREVDGCNRACRGLKDVYKRQALGILVGAMLAAVMPGLELLSLIHI